LWQATRDSWGIYFSPLVASPLRGEKSNPFFSSIKDWVIVKVNQDFSISVLGLFGLVSNPKKNLGFIELGLFSGLKQNFESRVLKLWASLQLLIFILWFCTRLSSKTQSFELISQQQKMGFKTNGFKPKLIFDFPGVSKIMSSKQKKTFLTQNRPFSGLL
jgi:hypothetical protein